MPKREDESWTIRKEQLRYCYKHKRYYHAKVGCQLCYLQEFKPKGELKMKLKGGAFWNIG